MYQFFLTHPVQALLFAVAMACASSTQNDSNTAYFDHFTCNLCLEVLQDPVQCVRNEHYFCKKCITKHLTRSQTCPVCQNALTPETLCPISRIVANLLQQFQSPRCRYASRGCTSAVRHEDLLSHHEECGFAPVQCSHEGCEATVDRQDLVSHQQNCEFRSITCEDCHEAVRQQEYEKHRCVLRRELNENKHDLVEMQKILREIQDEQRRQGEEMRQMAKDLRQPRATQGQQSGNLKQQASELKQASATQRQHSGNLGQHASETILPNSTQSDNTWQQEGELGQPSATQPQQANNCVLTGPSCMESDDVETVTASSPTQSQAPADRQIFVPCGRSSNDIFNWSTQQWSLHNHPLFFDHFDGFSFVYDNKIMICGGTDTNRVECLDITNNRPASTFPAQLPAMQCGKGVLCGDKILTFGESVSGTSLKPEFETTVLIPYEDGRTLSSYGVARVNENAVVIVGGYQYPKSPNRPHPCQVVKNDVLLYNPTTNVLKKLAPLPYQLSDMAVVVHDDNIIILGGYRANFISQRPCM